MDSFDAQALADGLQKQGFKVKKSKTHLYETTTSICHGGDAPWACHFFEYQGTFGFKCHTKDCDKKTARRNLYKAAGMESLRTENEYSQPRCDECGSLILGPAGTLCQKCPRPWDARYCSTCNQYKPGEVFQQPGKCNGCHPYLMAICERCPKGESRKPSQQSINDWWASNVSRKDKRGPEIQDGEMRKIRNGVAHILSHSAWVKTWEEAGWKHTEPYSIWSGNHHAVYLLDSDGNKTLTGREQRGVPISYRERVGVALRDILSPSKEFSDTDVDHVYPPFKDLMQRWLLMHGLNAEQVPIGKGENCRYAMLDEVLSADWVAFHGQYAWEEEISKEEHRERTRRRKVGPIHCLRCGSDPVEGYKCCHECAPMMRWDLINQWDQQTANPYIDCPKHGRKFTGGECPRCVEDREWRE